MAIRRKSPKTHNEGIKDFSIMAIRRKMSNKSPEFRKKLSYHFRQKSEDLHLYLHLLWFLIFQKIVNGY